MYSHPPSAIRHITYIVLGDDVFFSPEKRRVPGLGCCEVGDRDAGEQDVHLHLVASFR